MTAPRMRRVAALALVWRSGASRRSARDASRRRRQGAPKLLVIVVVDQMRFDYLDRYAQAVTARSEARCSAKARCSNAAFYPYLNTVTCAGHATIGTGAFRYAHGIIMNEWYQPGRGPPHVVHGRSRGEERALLAAGRADRPQRAAPARADARRSASCEPTRTPAS